MLDGVNQHIDSHCGSLGLALRDLLRQLLRSFRGVGLRAEVVDKRLEGAAVNGLPVDFVLEEVQLVELLHETLLVGLEHELVLVVGAE